MPRPNSTNQNHQNNNTARFREVNPLHQHSIAISEEVLDEFPGMPHKAHRITETDDQRSFFK